MHVAVAAIVDADVAILKYEKFFPIIYRLDKLVTKITWGSSDQFNWNTVGNDIFSVWLRETEHFPDIALNNVNTARAVPLLDVVGYRLDDGVYKPRQAAVCEHGHPYALCSLHKDRAHWLASHIRSIGYGDLIKDPS